jgi:hypothetical protein
MEDTMGGESSTKGEEKEAYKTLVEKPEEERSLGR